MLAHVIEIFLAGGALNHAACDGVAVGAVAELRPRLEEQRIGGEDRETLAHAAVVFRALDLALFVMADAGGVGEEFASGDRPLLLRERGAILLHRCIEVELACFNQRHGGGRGDWLGNRAGADERLGCGRHRILHISRSESL